MSENWYALYLCIISDREISIDKSLIKIGIQKDCKSSRTKYTPSEINCFSKLKNQGKSYSEIGKMFGMTRSQVAGIIRTCRIKATKNPDQSVQSSISNNSQPLYHIDGGIQVVS